MTSMESAHSLSTVETGREPSSRRLTPRTLVRALTVVALATTVLLPLVALILRSIADRWFFPDVIPQSWGLDSWDYTFGDSSRVLEALWNSLRLALLVTFLAILVGMPAARTLGQEVFRGKRTVEWILMMPILVPPMVSAMGIHIVFLKLGLTGTLIGVSLVHLIPATPYFVLVMSSVFANYGTELEDVARTLGANRFRVFVHVTFPAISSGLMVACLFTFLISWSQYVTTLLIGGGSLLTLPLVLFPFLSGGNAAVAASITLVFVAPAVLVLTFTSRSLGRGSTVMGGFGKL